MGDDKKELIKIIILVVIIILLAIFIMFIFTGNNSENNVTNSITNSQTKKSATNEQNKENKTENNVVVNKSSSNTNTNENTNKESVVKPEIVISDLADTQLTVRIDKLSGISSGVKEIQYAIMKWDSFEQIEYNVDKADRTSNQYTFKNLNPETTYKIYVQIYDNDNNVIALEKDSIKTQKTM